MAMARTGRAWRVVPWLFEIAAIISVALILMLPILDYDRRERMAQFLHPSAENMRALQAKQRQEFLVRLGFATPTTIAALLIAFRLRSKPAIDPA